MLVDLRRVLVADKPFFGHNSACILRPKCLPLGRSRSSGQGRWLTAVRPIADLHLEALLVEEGCYQETMLSRGNEQSRSRPRRRLLNWTAASWSRRAGSGSRWRHGRYLLRRMLFMASGTASPCTIGSEHGSAWQGAPPAMVPDTVQRACKALNPESSAHGRMRLIAAGCELRWWRSTAMFVSALVSSSSAIPIAGMDA
jgi:hypothetical protein